MLLFCIDSRNSIDIVQKSMHPFLSRDEALDTLSLVSTLLRIGQVDIGR